MDQDLPFELWMLRHGGDRQGLPLLVGHIVMLGTLAEHEMAAVCNLLVGDGAASKLFPASSRSSRSSAS